MRRIVRAIAAALLVALSAATQSVLAGDGPSEAEVRRRVEWLKTLPREDRERLKQALEKFRSLPEAERDELRRRAARVGAERLDGLSGRDLSALRQWRKNVTTDVDSVFRNIGDARLSGLSDDERAYMRSEAMRGFQRHLQRRVLGVVSYEDVDRLPPDERRKRLREGLDRVVAERFAQAPDEVQATLRTLRPEEARGRLLAEFREAETLEFAKIFDQHRIRRFEQQTPEARAKEVGRWREREHWSEAARVLREEIGISDEARRAFAALSPLDKARLVRMVRESEATSVQQRRADIEKAIQRFAGDRTLDSKRRGPMGPPWMERIRERRLMQPLEGPETQKPPATTK